jgi:hypothetical protein
LDIRKIAGAFSEERGAFGGGHHGERGKQGKRGFR